MDQRHPSRVPSLAQGGAMNPRLIPSWSVIVDGAIVYTGGYGRAKREADKRGGTLRPSETMIRVTV